VKKALICALFIAGLSADFSCQCAKGKIPRANVGHGHQKQIRERKEKTQGKTPEKNDEHARTE
jgi:hypothetical protein